MKKDATQQIREDFRQKSDTYFEVNYLANKNLNRQFRQELIRTILQDLDIQGKEVLDAGAGPGVLGEIVNELKGHYFASDISLHNIAASRKRLGAFPGIVADTTALPFGDHSFDFVLSIGSLEYIRDYPTAIHQLCRVLKPGGILIFTMASNQSPANWINDRLLYPFKKSKMKRRGKPIYKRYFSSLSQLKNLLSKDHYRVDQHYYITPGILDNQLKKINFLNKLERKLIRRFSILSPTNKEIVIVAKMKA